MADVKISALPQKTVASTDIVPVVDAAATTTSRVAAGDIASLALASPSFTGVVTVPDGTAEQPSFVSNVGSPNTGFFFPAEDVIAISTNGLERLRVGAGGRVLIGTTTSRSSGPTVPPFLQIEGTSAGGGGQQQIVGSTVSYVCPYVLLVRHRGIVGESTIVESGDSVGLFSFRAGDGVDVTSEAAAIECVIDGQPGVNDMPGRLVFKTSSDGTKVAVERMRITSGGLVGIGTTSPASTLHVNGSLRASSLTDGTATKSVTSVLSSPSLGSIWALS